MGNYAVRLGQKPVRSSRLFLCIFLTFEQLLVDLDCAGGLSNIPGSICAATMTRVIPPVSSWVSQPWHRAPLAFFVAHEKPDSDPDSFLNAVTCVEKITVISFAISFENVLFCRYLGLSIQKRVTALQASGCQLLPLFNPLLHVFSCSDCWQHVTTSRRLIPLLHHLG